MPDPPVAAAPDRSGERSFWQNVGTTFPSLKGAASTAYYLECERLLFEEFFPDLRERSLFKTDLWDEAKNSEILLWAAEQGARPAGIDIAFDVVRQSARLLAAHRPQFVVSDIRAVPFASGTFDLVYSMGTIEHFHETEVAIAEIFRILKGGGRAIIGVPNKLDPFLRPAMVALLNRFGWYAYGMEKSYTRRHLACLLEAAGFRVVGHSGILFMPGWLRMINLLCHTRFPALAAVSADLVHPFAWLYRRFPKVRRYGYLIACAVEKPVLRG